MASAARPLARNFGDLVAEMAGRDPEAPAVIEAGGRLTYGELDARLDAFAGGLAALGLQRGGTLGLLCTNRWEWVVAALGAHRVGARVAAFNTFAKAWDLEYMIEHSGSEMLVCVDGFRSRDYRETLAELVPELSEPGAKSARFEALREVVVIGDKGDLAGARGFNEVIGLEGSPEAEIVPPANADAFVLYTSGSSARPKAVPLLQGASIENGFAIGERMGLTNADRVLVAVPLFWAYGALNALPASFGHGAAMVLQPAFEPTGALDLIEEHEATAIYTLPNMTGALLDHEAYGPDRVASLRTGLTLGTPAEVKRAAVDLGAEKICNIYGGTETYGNCCVTPSSWPLERRMAGQGPPLPGVEVRIADRETEELLGAGEVGEIQVRGYLTRGYLGDSSGSGAAFGADGWYRTGDLGSLDENGDIAFSSRATEMIKTGGINVAPREVEEFLAMHDAVASAAVVGVPDEQMAEVVVAFVVAREGEHPSEADLRSFCGERIAGYKVPVRIHLVAEMPATDTGKLARRELVELDRQAVGA
jgi:fatty-acyl-CoA synthase